MDGMSAWLSAADAKPGMRWTPAMAAHACDPRILLSPKERMPPSKLLRTINDGNHVARTITAARLM